MPTFSLVQTDKTLGGSDRYIIEADTLEQARLLLTAEKSEKYVAQAYEELEEYKSDGTVPSSATKGECSRWLFQRSVELRKHFYNGLKEVL